MLKAVKEKEITFYGNHNNASCGQCVYRMILSHLFPEKSWPLFKMDEICGATPGKYTWMYKPIVELQKMGLEITVLTKFNTQEFIKSPEAYLTKQYGPEGCKDNIENSDMPSLIKQAQEYILLLQQKQIQETEIYYTVSDIKSFLDQGYLLNIWVNSRKLNKIEGQVGHFILVHDYNDTSFIAHDPGGNYEDGRPKNQFKDRTIPQDELISAACPRRAGETAELIAIRKKV